MLALPRPPPPTRRPGPPGPHARREAHSLRPPPATRALRVSVLRAVEAASKSAPVLSTRPAAISALASLLATADDPASPPADADAAEGQAIALARRLAGQDERTGRAPGEASTSTSTSASSSEGEEVAAPPPPPPTTIPTILLRGFGRARQVPKRAYTLVDLRLNKVEPDALLSPTDATLDGVRRKLRNGAIALSAVLLAVSHPASPTPVLVTGVVGAGVWVADAVGTGGALASLALDVAGRALAPSYARRVAAHEAGHFLIAFLVGLIPRGYTLSSAAAWAAEARARGLGAALAGITRPAAQAGTRLCDSAFRAEVASGKIRAATVDAAVCVALAGVTAEYLGFGSAEGGLDDVAQLDGLLRALGFSQAKADSQIRWAVLNDAALLRRYAATHAALAGAMERGASVGECIGVIEGELDKMSEAEL